MFLVITKSNMSAVMLSNTACQWEKQVLSANVRLTAAAAPQDFIADFAAVSQS